VLLIFLGAHVERPIHEGSYKEVLLPTTTRNISKYRHVLYFRIF